MLEDLKQFYLLMWLKKNQLERPFKDDNVTSNCENCVLYFSEKDQKIAAFAELFLIFIDQTIAWKWFWFPSMIWNTHITR